MVPLSARSLSPRQCSPSLSEALLLYASREPVSTAFLHYRQAASGIQVKHSPPTHPQQKQISKTKERKKDSVRIVIPYRRNILCFLFHQVKVLSWGLLSYSFWSFSAFVCLFRHFPLLGQLWFWIVKSILAMTHQGWSGNTTANVVSVHKHFYSSSWNEPLFAVVPK